MRSLRFYLLIVVALTMTGCNSCKKPDTTTATLTISGQIDGCDYYTYTTNSNQTITVIVEGKYGYQWSQTFNGKSSTGTYQIGVPDKYDFTIKVVVEENDFLFTNNADCKQCSVFSCPNGSTGRPRWEGTEAFSSSAAGSFDVPVAIPTLNDMYCRC